MSLRDIVVAAVSGAVSYLGVWSGIISGGYAFYVALENGADVGKAAISGLSAAYGTICIGGISGDADLLGKVVDITFGLGGNLVSGATSAGVNATISSSDNYKEVYNTPVKKINYCYTNDDMRKELRYLYKKNMKKNKKIVPPNINRIK